MLERSYIDFNELFLKLPTEILQYPDELVKYRVANQFYIDPVLIEVKKPDIDIDFSFIGYKPMKIKQLLTNYVDLDSWKEYKERIKNSKSLSLTFYFNQRKKIKGSNQDASPCILNFILSRKNRSEKFDEMFIYYRTVDLGRTMYLDMVLFNQMIKDLGDLVNLKSIRFFIPYGFLHVANIQFFLKLHPMELDEKNEFTKNVIRRKERLLRKVDFKYKSEKRIKKFLTGELNIEPISSIDLFKGEEK